MAGYLLSLLVFALLSQLGHQAAAPRIQTKLGGVVGTAREGEDGSMIYSFQGIPYTKPPIGELRFKPPQPADPWENDFFATSDEAICIQRLAGPTNGNEDCLILNVYTPWDPSTSPLSDLLSVMVFIHGGGFVGGWSGTSFVGHPDYLLHHNVVLVTINYRVGVMGFLSTEDEIAPGNYGLLDQIEALKWIKENIASFGGNPNQVTIFGESAGGAFVHLLMMSPLAKGLFHRAIAQSGTNISPGSLTYTAKSNAQALAAKLGCSKESSQELVECLRRIDAKELVDADIVEPEQRIGIWPVVWSPRVDSEAAEPSLPKHPIDLMSSGDYYRVPLLIGHASSEGAGFLLMGGEFYKLTANLITNNWDHYCKLNLAIREALVAEDKGSEMCNEVRDTYVDSSKEFDDNKMGYADLLGDAALTSGIYISAELMSSHSPVYNYIFDFESKEYSFLKLLFSAMEKVDGIVCHADDLLYLFKYPKTGWTQESPEYEMVEMMSQIWTGFAKNGEPSISKLDTNWPKASWPNHSYMVIDAKPYTQQNYRPDKMKKLQEIYSEYIYKIASKKHDEL